MSAEPWLPDEAVEFPRLDGWTVTGAWVNNVIADGTARFWQRWDLGPDNADMAWVPLTDPDDHAPGVMEDYPFIVRRDPAPTEDVPLHEAHRLVDRQPAGSRGRIGGIAWDATRRRWLWTARGDLTGLSRQTLPLNPDGTVTVHLEAPGKS